MKALIPMMLLFSLSSVAGKPIEVDCVGCSGKLTTTVKPDITVAMNLKKDLAQPKEITKGLSIEKPLELKVKSYVEGCKIEECFKRSMCTKFHLAKDKWDIEEMFDLIPTMPQFNKVDDYFNMIECSPIQYNQNIGIKAPMIHLIVDEPVKRQDFLETIFDSYELSGDGAKLTKILNLKSTENETFLDYLYFTRKKNRTAYTEPSKKALENIFKYACEKGAEFSKYKSEANCKTPIGIQADKK